MSSNNFNYLEIIEYLKSEKIKVSVFGEFSSGKTTFLNALINENILTAAYEPTTAVPTRIRYKKSFNILIHLLSDKTLKLYSDDREDGAWRRYIGRSGGSNILGLLKKKESQIQEFLSKWTKEGQSAKEVKEVVVELPLEWLKNKIELIDTPGPNNEFFKHKELTESLASETDIAIMLIDGRQGGGKKSEFTFLNKINRSVKDSIVVINFMDRLDVSERDEVLEFIKDESIPKNWENPILPDVHGISALLQLGDFDTEDKKTLKKNFKDFLSNIKNRIEKKRGSILLDRLGNPDKKIYVKAKQLEKSSSDKDLAIAIQTYDELKDILIAANLNPQPAEDGLTRCEERYKEKLKLIKSFKDQFKLLDQKNISNENYLKKIKKINNSLIDLEEYDDEIQAKIGSVDSLIKQIAKDKKEIKDQLSNAKKLIKGQKDFSSLENARKLFLSAMKLMKEYDLDITDVEKEIKRCDENIKRSLKKINLQLDKYNNIDEKISILERYKIVDIIHENLSSLNADTSPESHQVKSVAKELFALQKKVNISIKLTERIKKIESSIDKDFKTIKSENDVVKRWMIIPKLLGYSIKIESLLTSAYLEKNHEKIIFRLINKIKKLNETESNNLNDKLLKAYSSNSLVEKKDSYNELKAILSVIKNNYSEFNEYEEFLNNAFPYVTKAIKKIKQDQLAFNKTEKNIGIFIKQIKSSLKNKKYDIIPLKLNSLGVTLSACSKDKQINQYVEVKNFLRNKKRWAKKIIIDVEKMVNDDIDNLKTTNGKKVLALEKKRLEGIASYLKEKHDIIINLNVITELGKSIYRKNFKWAVIIAAPIFFIILAIVNEGDLTISFSDQNTRVSKPKTRVSKPKTRVSKPKTRVNKEKRLFFSNFDEAEFNNALRFNLFDKAESLVNKARLIKKDQYYRRLINACIDNNHLSRAATIFYTNNVPLSDNEIHRLGMAFVRANYFSKAEALFKSTNNQKFGIEMAEYYIEEARINMKTKGIVQKRRVHTDESFLLKNRAKRIINALNSRGDVNRLYRLINNLEDN